MTEPGNRGEFSYDVAFSFAEEDREYVERVAKAVEGQLRLFYDGYEQIDLWGKNLHAHLAEVYGQKSRFCVMFISRHYAKKLWTSHEREAAQARAFADHQTYILPARFDDTSIPGVLPTVGYVDLRSLTPEAFAKTLLEKVASAKAGRRPLPQPDSPPRRRWLMAAPAMVLVASAIGVALSLVSEARGSKAGRGAEDAGARAETRADAGAATAVSAKQTNPSPGDVNQTVEADGQGSESTVKGGMNVNRQAGGNTEQKVKATKGGKVTVTGGMNYTGP